MSDKIKPMTHKRRQLYPQQEPCPRCDHVHSRPISAPSEGGKEGFILWKCWAATCGDGCCSCDCAYWSPDPLNPLRWYCEDATDMPGVWPYARIEELERMTGLQKDVIDSQREALVKHKANIREAEAKAMSAFALRMFLPGMEHLEKQGLLPAFKALYPELWDRLGGMVERMNKP